MSLVTGTSHVSKMFSHIVYERLSHFMIASHMKIPSSANSTQCQPFSYSLSNFSHICDFIFQLDQTKCRFSWINEKREFSLLDLTNFQTIQIKSVFLNTSNSELPSQINIINLHLWNLRKRKNLCIHSTSSSSFLFSSKNGTRVSRLYLFEKKNSFKLIELSYICKLHQKLEWLFPIVPSQNVEMVTRSSNPKSTWINIHYLLSLDCLQKSNIQRCCP